MANKTMTVKELIEALSECDQDAIVFAYINDEPRALELVDQSFDGTRVDINVYYDEWVAA